MSSPRQPAYDAVYAVIRQHPPRAQGGYEQAAENARVWRAVEAALDAVGVPRFVPTYEVLSGEEFTSPVEAGT